MGYDMYWESPPGNLAELNAEANRLWGEADRLHKTEPAQAKARSDQGSEIYGRYIKGAQKIGAYFRANVWGMQSLRAEMAGRMMQGKYPGYQLPEAFSESVLAEHESGDEAATPAKRGPGRPRKEAVPA